MANCVDAEVQTMEASVPKAPLNRLLPPDTERPELPPRDHPVLLLRNRCDGVVNPASPF